MHETQLEYLLDSASAESQYVRMFDDFCAIRLLYLVEPRLTPEQIVAREMQSFGT